MTKWRIQIETDDKEQADAIAELLHAVSYETVEVLVIPLEDECEHIPFTYTKHPSGDIITKCRECSETLEEEDA